MVLVRRIVLLCVGLAAAGSQAYAAEATLVADTHVNSALPSVNSGAISNLNVGAGYTTLLQFDLTTLPTGVTASQVTRATLRLFCNRMNTAGLVSVQPVSGAWGEYSVTFATLPALGAATQLVQVTQANAYVAVDVTSLVQGWIATPATNNGVALTAGTAAVQFDSKENDLTGHAATLDITLMAGTVTGGGTVGPQGPAGPSGPVGPSGPAGPQGISGGSGLNFQGVYSSTVNYGLGDVTTFQGSSFVSLLASNHGNTPGLSPGQWGVLAQGATGSSGPGGGSGAALAYQGIYASASNYALGDIVSFQGSSYVSLNAGNHGNTPGLTTGYWGLLAAAGVGSTGAAGPQGPTGPQGLIGPPGAAGQPGPIGATGAQGLPGLPGLVYRGAYASTSNYALGDVVLWQGASYTSLLPANHGNTPDFSPQQWGVLSPQGNTGPQGLQGTQGISGTQGPPGSVGPPGSTGAQGPQGIAGQSGAQGIPGAAGTQGLSGPMGPAGPAGPVGMTFRGTYSSALNYALADGVTYNGAGYVSLLAGNRGNTPDASPSAWVVFASGTAGATGAAGPAGPQGLTGAPGTQGAAGTPGAAGPAGPQGPPVANYTGNYASTTNYALHDAVSYAGSTYISLVAGNRGNTPDASPSAWALLAAQGAAGPVGAAGATGPAGSPGATGAAGATGPQGPPVSFTGGWLIGTPYPVGSAVSYAGSSFIALVANTGRQPDISPSYWALLAQSGAAGPAGPTGATGMQGPTGYPGPQGASGPPGPAGASGPQGPAGGTGASGLSGPAGPAGASGPAGLVYRGAYTASTNYGLNDAVTYLGSSYISALASNRGNSPDQSPFAWSLLAAQGSAGTAGTSGVTGPQGPQGSQGPQGVAGPTGPAGAVGITYRGTWGAGPTYHANDVVEYAGASFLATVTSNAAQPDISPAQWAVLAGNGSTGATGPSGTAATVSVGTVTTGASGTQASVTNTGTAAAAVLNFTIPQGAAGANGTGGGGGGAGTSGIPFASVYHAVSYNSTYYSVNNANASSFATESDSILTWLPAGCTATQLNVFSRQTSFTPIIVTLRQGTPGAMTDTALSCSASYGGSCTQSGSITIAAGSFVDLSITKSNSQAGAVWTTLACN
ncbi:MAG: DNRLRE domain-containing protein [Acidobacteriota bacterium]|nr:DNRLRE domain-containing protein [Acidobacteriota bacterium]